MAKPTQQEINDVLNDVQDAQDEGIRRWPGMSYEDGVVAALRWVNGDEPMHPYEEEA